MLINKSKANTTKFDSAIEMKLNKSTGSSQRIRGAFSKASRRLSALSMFDKEAEHPEKPSIKPLSVPTCINE